MNEKQLQKKIDDLEIKIAKRGVKIRELELTTIRHEKKILDIETKLIEQFG